MGIQAELRSGTKLRIEPPCPAVPRAWSSSCNLAIMPSRPPSTETAATASTTTMVILITNWNRSVTSTPHKPARVEMNEVRAIIPSTMASAVTLSTPSTSIRILTIARFTQPRTMQLIGIPR